MKIKNTEIKIVQGDIMSQGAEFVFEDVNAKGPISEQTLRETCVHELKDAYDSTAESVILPPIGCKNGFPPVGSAKIIIQEILKFFRRNETRIEEIIICLNDEETFNIFKDTVTGYVSHIQTTLGEEPYVTVDVIIEMPEGVILIERSNPPYGLALPGGFLDPNESLEVAAVREAKEETNMDLEDLRQFHTYSEPGRDPRFHTISTVFIAKGIGTPQFGDDAKGLKVIPYNELLNHDYAFDHKQVIKDYLAQK